MVCAAEALVLKSESQPAEPEAAALQAIFKDLLAMKVTELTEELASVASRSRATAPVAAGGCMRSNVRNFPLPLVWWHGFRLGHQGSWRPRRQRRGRPVVSVGARGGSKLDGRAYLQTGATQTAATADRDASEAEDEKVRAQREGKRVETESRGEKRGDEEGDV